MSQTVAAVGVLIAAGLSFAVFYCILQVPMSVAIYLALPFAMPIAIGGFYKIHGMSPYEYLRLKRKVKQQDTLFYRSLHVTESRTQSSYYLKKQQGTPIGKKIYLETDEEMYERMKEVDAILEKEKKDAGI